MYVICVYVCIYIYIYTSVCYALILMPVVYVGGKHGIWGKNALTWSGRNPWLYNGVDTSKTRLQLAMNIWIWMDMASICNRIVHMTILELLIHGLFSMAMSPNGSKYTFLGSVWGIIYCYLAFGGWFVPSQTVFGSIGSNYQNIIYKYYIGASINSQFSMAMLNHQSVSVALPGLWRCNLHHFPCVDHGDLQDFDISIDFILETMLKSHYPLVMGFSMGFPHPGLMRFVPVPKLATSSPFSMFRSRGTVIWPWKIGENVD